MANHLTVGTVSLSSSLRASCDTETEWRDGDVREITWRPRNVSPQNIAEAKSKTAALDRALLPADISITRKWLGTLGVMCAGKMEIADARAKIAVYAANLRHPEFCFTQDTLVEAGKKFTWFPSFAEVSAFLDEIEKPTRELAERVKRIAEMQPTVQGQSPQPVETLRRYAQYDEADKKEFDDMMDRLRGRFPTQRAAPDDQP